MNQEELQQQHQKTLRAFGMIGAIILVGLIAGGVFVSQTIGHKNQMLQEAEMAGAESKMIMEQSILLSDRYSSLQNFDENYATMLGTSGVNMDSADNIILEEEKSFEALLDRMDQRVKGLDRSLAAKKIEALISTYRLALLNRKYLAGIRNSLNGVDLSTNKEGNELMSLRLAMKDKDRQISELKKPGSVKTSSVSVNRDSLESELKEEEFRNVKLLDLTNNLRDEITGLKAQLRQAKSMADNGKTTFTDQNEQLQDQVEEMTAELYFAKVDCSLLRADANEIISSSKQRKQLLSEALQVLSTLSASANPAVKNKALEKLSVLKAVSSNVRE